MFSLGGAGLMVIIVQILPVVQLCISSSEKVLDQTHNPSTPKINRMMLQV